MSDLRVYELAHKLGVKNSDMIEMLDKIGIEAKSHMSLISDFDRKKFLDYYKTRFKDEYPNIERRKISTARVVSNDFISELLSNNILFEAAKNITKYAIGDLNQEIKEITNIYKDGKLVFVLGAGVSDGHAIPDWSTLLQKLLLTTLIENDKENFDQAAVFAQIFTKLFSPDPLIVGRYLLDKYNNKRNENNLLFENAVREALYSNIDLSSESSLLKEIRQFSIAPGKSPNIDSIITYNFDDLLERYLSNSKIDLPFEPIYAPGMNPGKNKLPIYHVHGYLPQNEVISFENQITLSEDIYHKQYSDIYGWSNLVQINKFKDFNCLFIGTSFTDPNLRRILDIAKKHRGDNEINHYCFKKRRRPDEIQVSLKDLLEKDKNLLEEKSRNNLDFEKTAKDLISFMETFEEADLRSFGVATIWVDDYEDIPPLLEKIRKSAQRS